MNLPPAVAPFIELPLNRALQLDVHTLQSVIALSGKIIAIDLQVLNVQFYLAPTLDGIQVLSEYDGEPDTTIRGTPLSLLQVAITKERDALIKGDVVIDGDMQLGQKFQRILNGLDIDWEEPLSKIVGDVAAHQMGEAVRGFADFGLKALSSLTHSTSEYYQEETQDVVTSTELDRFSHQVDKTRSDIDRMEARVNKLIASDA